MRQRILAVVGAAAVIAFVSVTVATVWGQAQTTTSAQTTTAKTGPAPKTVWGEPDLQGIWYQTYAVPLQRAPRVADKEVLTEAERKAQDEARVKVIGRDKRSEVGTEKDVAGAYNAVFSPLRLPAGERTSLIIDPKDGRIPPTTAAAQKEAAVERDYRLALLQNTATCKNKDRGNACANWEYGPPSPKWDEVTPFYNTGRLNRHAGPEDGSGTDRCLPGGNPDLNGFRRIVQTPGGISMYYDIGQGQGYQRNIVMNGTPHLPASVRQWWGDSRGHWEGNTLVVDVTNFTPKTSFNGSRENLHLIERWTRIDKDNLEYIVTVDDPTVWTKPWTVKLDLGLQSNEANRFYTEPRCHEGNYALPSLMLGERLEEAAFAEGRGPHPASFDNSTCDGGEGVDALAGGGAN
jgi:hypothetical protein